MESERSVPRLIFPKAFVHIENRKYQIPFGFDVDGAPLYAANAWLRHLSVARGLSSLSIRNYAFAIFDFFHHLANFEHPKRWNQCTNSDIRSWRNVSINQGNKAGTTKQSLLCLFKFLSWSHKFGYLETRVRSTGEEYVEGDLTPEECDLLVPPKGFLTPPSTSHMDAVQQMIAAHGGKHKVRNMLMFRWAKEVGLRNSEIRTLQKAQIPTYAEIEAARRQGRTLKIRIKGKGNKIRAVEPPQGLVNDTRDFFEQQSANSKYIFTSEKGTQLRQQWISKLFAGYFKLAGLDSHLHRARAYYLFTVTLLKVQELAKAGRLDEFSVSTIIRFVLDLAGHESVDTLRHYVTLAALSLNIEQVQFVEPSCPGQALPVDNF